MTSLLGIDPGVHGALVWHPSPVARIDVLDMPTYDVPRGKGVRKVIDMTAVCAWISHRQEFLGGIDLVLIEEVGAMPGNGGSSMFNFGYGCGAIYGACIMAGLNVTYVRPEAWTKAMGCGRDKNRHRETAKVLFANQAELFALVKHDGRADAALLTAWARRQ